MTRAMFLRYATAVGVALLLAAPFPAGAGPAAPAVKPKPKPAVASDICVQYQPGAVPALRAGGSAAKVPMKLTNCGRLDWNTAKSAALKGVTLEYHWVLNGTPLPPDNAGTDFGGLAAGAAASFKAKLKPPPRPGSYALRWDLRLPDGTWFSGKGAPPAEQAPITVK